MKSDDDDGDDDDGVYVYVYDMIERERLDEEVSLFFIPPFPSSTRRQKKTKATSS